MVCDDCPGGPDWVERARRAEAERDAAYARIAELEAALDEAQLQSIEARNPGIDMEQVKALRSRATRAAAAADRDRLGRYR